jgi:hypothetical protein
MTANLPGFYLMEYRHRLRLTTRKVEELSRQIVLEKNNEEFLISHARLVQIERGESTPSIYKLYSLSVIYGCRIIELLKIYMDFRDANSLHLSLPHPATHVLDARPTDMEQKIDFPTRLDSGTDVRCSGLLSQLIVAWGEIPVGLFQGLNLRQGRWGFIGLNDYTMFPLLRPGSLVQIDDSSGAAATHNVYRSEYDRPIYFLQLRSGYVCSWCEFNKHSIIAIAHPLSGVKLRRFEVPAEAEVIGRVTAIAARLVPSLPMRTAGSAVVSSSAIKLSSK